MLFLSFTTVLFSFSEYRATRFTRFSESTMRKQAAVRLEGGLGDHILGMRLLQFVRRRYPGHLMVVYCDCGGYRSQLEAGAKSLPQTSARWTTFSLNTWRRCARRTHSLTLGPGRPSVQNREKSALRSCIYLSQGSSGCRTTISWRRGPG